VEEVRIEVHAGLNVVENWHSGGDFIFYGKGEKSKKINLRSRKLPSLVSTYCKIA
jgi:TnpA family transposase